MIASLRGPVLSIGADHAVVDCAGVGYVFLATPATLAGLRRGDEATVLTHLAVKEDAMTLYGFTSDEERRMFLLLQTLSGMGPKLALATIGTLSPAEISSAVANSDAKRLQTVPGVGKRMADRMVVELKDKVTGYADVGAGETPVVVGGGVAERVVEALVGLGFTEKDAAPVVEGVYAKDPTADVSTGLKAALAELGRARSTGKN